MAVPVAPDPDAVRADDHHDAAEKGEGYGAPAPAAGPPEGFAGVGVAHGAVLPRAMPAFIASSPRLLSRRAGGVRAASRGSARWPSPRRRACGPWARPGPSPGRSRRPPRRGPTD